MKDCIACGMPMRNPQDYAMNDESKDYCVHCARDDGSMCSYEEQLMSMTIFLSSTQGFSRDEAREAAAKRLAALPAWQDR